MADNSSNNNNHNNNDDLDEFFAQFNTGSENDHPSSDRHSSNISNDDDFYAQLDAAMNDHRSSASRSRSSSRRSSSRSGRRSASDKSSASDKRAARTASDKSSASDKRSAPDKRAASDKRTSSDKRAASDRRSSREKYSTQPASKGIPKTESSAAALTAAASADKAQKGNAGKSTGKKAGASSSGRGGRFSKRPAAAQTSGKSGSKHPKLKFVGFLVVAILLGAGIYVGAIFAMTPAIDTDDIYANVSQRSIIYDSDGKEIDNLYLSDGNRTIVEYDDIPEDMVNAVVSIEDKKFWSHSGFNFVRMIGAIRDSLTGNSQISGTSTVTQQLARNVYLTEIKGQRSMNRKLSEAYYTMIIEKNLSKEEIMEAYLNTIYLGFNSYGVQAASQSYFSKNVEDLDTLECAALAALPQSPDTYALVLADYEGAGASSLPTISSADSVTYLYNGAASADRRDLVIKNMASSGFISDSERDKLLDSDLEKHIKINAANDASRSSYFVDYAIDQLEQDIVSEYGLSLSDAQKMIYTGGLKIYTTMDSNIQSIVEEEFDDDSNFASVSYVKTDSNGNILNDKGKIQMYDYSYYFDDKDQFTLKKSEYKMNDDGSMTIYAGKRLNIYETEVNDEPDVSIEFKGMYTTVDGAFYFIENGALSIPQGYKSVDGDGNAVISASFFTDYPDFFVSKGSGYTVKSNNYTLKQKVRQPQAAMVIMENSTGEIKAMIGGRGTTGKSLYNRATSTRQPGSAIKPIAVYGPALQMSYEYEKEGKTISPSNSDGSNWGAYITAGSIINDAEMVVNGKVWPKNNYSGYRGQMTLRTAVQQSVNVCAVKVFQNVGADYSASMVKKVGVTSIVEDGEVNDMNAAALGLGGLTNGISPLELMAAYATFPNGGQYTEPVSYTKVVDGNGDTILKSSPKTEQAYDEGVAWIMTDILRTVVTQGIGSGAAISSQPVGGKTGTTSDNYDAWFCGFTPQYTAALWMGNDINIQLSSNSAKSASFWSSVMGRVCADLPRESFFEKPSNVVTVGGEYYTEGTYSKVGKTSTKDSNKSDESSEKESSSSTTQSTTAPTTRAQTTAPTTTTEQTTTTETTTEETTTSTEANP